MHNLFNSVTELKHALLPLSLIRRKAILFALETGVPPATFLDKSYKELVARRMSAHARSIIRSVPRHLRINYAFWEYAADGVAMPLFHIEDDMRRVFSADFPVVKRSYDALKQDIQRKVSEIQFELETVA